MLRPYQQPLPEMFNSKATRFVWTLNGYLLLLVLFFVLGQIGKDIGLPWSNATHHERGLIVGEAAEVARQLKVSVQHLEYDRPEHVSDSPYYFSSVYVMDKNMPEEIKEIISSAGDVSRNMIGARINVLFFKEDRSEVHKLLEQNGYIHTIDVPSQRYGTKTTESVEDLPNYILYQIVTQDTNGDHRINQDDAMAYYLSDLSGKKLKQISPDRLHLTDHWFATDFSEIYFEEIIEDPTETIEGFEYRLQERKLYYYTIQSDQFGAFDELQNVFREIEADYNALHDQ